MWKLVRVSSKWENCLFVSFCDISAVFLWHFCDFWWIVSHFRSFLWHFRKRLPYFVSFSYRSIVRYICLSIHYIFRFHLLLSYIFYEGLACSPRYLELGRLSPVICSSTPRYFQTQICHLHMLRRVRPREHLSRRVGGVCTGFALTGRSRAKLLFRPARPQTSSPVVTGHLGRPATIKSSDRWFRCWFF